MTQTLTDMKIKKILIIRPETRISTSTTISEPFKKGKYVVWPDHNEEILADKINEIIDKLNSKEKV